MAGGHRVGSPDVSISYPDAQRLGQDLLNRVNGGGMPPACDGDPGDANCLTVAQVALIQAWIDDGSNP
jgi:hypothetical protein